MRTNGSVPARIEEGSCLCSRRELIFIFGLAFLITSFTALVRPTFDDAGMELRLAAGQKACEGYSDRPIYSGIGAFLGDHHMIWPAGLLMHWMGWGGFGLAAAAVWGRLSDYPQYRVAAACLAMSPIVCDYQLPVMASVFGIASILLAFAAVWVLESAPGRLPSFYRALGALSLIFLSVMICEYGIPTIAAATVIFVLPGLAAHEPLERRRQWLTLVLLLGGVLVSYAIYWSTADANARPAVRPENISVKPALEILRNCLRGANALWYGCCGAFLKRLGGIGVADSVAVLSLCVGLAIAGVAHAAFNRRAFAQHGGAVRLAWQPMWRLLAGIVVGMVPVLIMGRRFPTTLVHDGGPGRYWMVVLPFIAPVTLWMLLQVLRGRLRLAVVPLCAFVGAYYICDLGFGTLRERRISKRWASAVEPFASNSGMTVAVFDFPAAFRKVPDYELTWRLTAGWPQDKRAHFWAFSHFAEAERYMSGLEWPDRIDNPYIERDFGAGLKWSGPVSTLLSVRVQDAETIEVVTSKPAEKNVGETPVNWLRP